MDTGETGLATDGTDCTDKKKDRNFLSFIRGGMSFVNGAPWNAQDAVAERTEAVSP